MKKNNHENECEQKTGRKTRRDKAQTIMFWGLITLLVAGSQADALSRIYQGNGINLSTTKVYNDTISWDYDTTDKAYTQYLHFNRSGEIVTIQPNTWTNITILDSNNSENFLHNNTTGHITILKNATYKVAFDMQFTGVDKITYDARLRNGEVIEGSRVSRTIKGIQETVEIDANALSELSAGTTVVLQVKHNDNQPEDINYTRFRIGMHRII